LLGAHLARSGQDVILIARGRHLAAMQANGVTVRSRQGDFTARPRCTDDVSAVAAAEACFQQALDVARRQGALSWELRAAMSLARFWRGQQRVNEARKLLAPVYRRFTEGFETADLVAAKALLASVR